MDPWDDEAARPTPPPMYGRASVPTPGTPPDPTEAMPLVASSRPPARGAKPISWQRAGSASRRSLEDGWGISATGLLVAFCGWGVWAAAGRGSIAWPLVGFLFMLAAAVAIFALSRLLGFIVLAQMMNRRRLHARWAHLAAGLFLTVGGISYLANSTWVTGAEDWIRATLEWIVSQWQRIPWPTIG